MKETLRSALTTDTPGLKVVVAEGECMLNRQRRCAADPTIGFGRRVKRARFISIPTCTGDHGCIRSGVPSLTIRDNPDPLRSDPVSYVDNSCVGCGVLRYQCALCRALSLFLEGGDDPAPQCVGSITRQHPIQGSRVVAGSRSEAYGATLISGVTRGRDYQYGDRCARWRGWRRSDQLAHRRRNQRLVVSEHLVGCVAQRTGATIYYS